MLNNIAIFGGTFNPVHNGHIAISKLLISKQLVDEVWIMPSYVSPHKKKDIMGTYDARIEMLKIAFSDEKAISISMFEKEYCIQNKIEKSYTSIILKGFKEQNKNFNFKFVLGFDSAKCIKKWYDSEYLIKNYEFIVFDRNDEFLKTILEKKEYLNNEIGFKYTYIEEKIPDISSTELKVLLNDVNKNKDKILEYIPKKVYDYILNNNLYKYENNRN